MPGDYRTVAGTVETEMTVKGSRFIGIVVRCPDEVSLRSSLEEISSRYPNATHYCYAACYGGASRVERFSDNGEPSGTAGRPMMSVVRGSGLSDVLCVVVRYFGGTLLGTGGLVHAYTEASSMAMEKVVKVDRIWCDECSFVLDYQQFNRFPQKFDDLIVGAPSYEYSDRVSVKIHIRESDMGDFARRMSEFGEGRIPINYLGHSYSESTASQSSL